jgi:hypothetical protein
MTLNFEKPEISFLGHTTLNKYGMKADIHKMETVKSFRQPKNKEEMASFFCLLTYVARFISHLATEPLRKLTRKHSKFL